MRPIFSIGGHCAAFIRKRLAALGIGLFLSLSATAQNTPLGDAQRLLKQGRPDAALAEVESFLGANPKDAQARFLKGLILTEQDKISEATEVFVRLTQDYPELPEPYNNLAVLYAQQRDYEKARTALEMAIRTHPAYAVAYENLGDVYAKLASQAYDKALKIDSGNSVAQGKLSLIRELFGSSVKTSDAAPGSLGSRTPKLATKPAIAAPANTAPAKPTSAVQVAAGKAAPTQASDAKSASPTPVKAVDAKPVIAKAPAAQAPAPAPAPVPNRAQGDPSVSLSQVTQALESWARAWSDKDVAGYLAHYDSAYRPDARTSHEAWASSRKIRVGKPGDISVDIADVEVRFDADGTAIARFHQRYRSENLNSNTFKTLVLKKAGERWVIVEERLG